ncbi:hypothetical protein B0T16DRAFT_496149 [Cercophora newfieldiana]|uniref:Uncharacterized protein n=1 Tax=Cercophora newfieldiana TaxID=92897 RepID=A0AA39XWA4_9PEZI|nr:hypothetical protein B0T16DRAFT_496149 [Cercophora newfieldiana]
MSAAQAADLTLHDMHLLVSGRLGANKQYQVRSPELGFLAGQIVAKAEGVFLWVHLVLNTVEESLCDGAGADALREIIELLPSDLNQLFERLFDSIPTPKLHGALQKFSVILQTHDDRLALRCYPFLDQHLKDRDFAVKMEPKPMDTDAVEQALCLARRNLRGQCKGFLEQGFSDSHQETGSFHGNFGSTSRLLTDLSSSICGASVLLSLKRTL